MSYTETDAGVIAFTREMLEVKIFRIREEMGRKAALDVSVTIRKLLGEKDEINVIFAAAPSQSDFLKELRADPLIPWERINAFHMDEYIGLEADAPQGFGNFLRERIFGKVQFKSVHYINGLAEDISAECKRYAALLEQYPTDIVCLGIGENGHIAFNDPPVADFDDPEMVKVVELELACRQQQVNENLFTGLDKVPTHAITVTIPALLKADRLFCMVPAKNKAKAVYRTLNGEIGEECPASILRRKKGVVLYLDRESSSLLDMGSPAAVE
ncbi:MULTISPECIES: glucosamine-6-phosphate deaminase [Petrimonas]|jgi:glucosamine-6-phosphate deaminase|uniref:glucosamine-6-phosphate deaminase n=1 Tax=Petrimonas TaxID=307628 RepID=UPI0008E05489|nr:MULTISPECIES: glucosamine-6-phosphate deaminase [Petrimonas]SFU50453.1 glucosamine-6-phosphate deaminase [Porphyromonadaceae bacterium KHP3R9]HHT29719.1 glucosamine-6-phosphate deaminase [Petrimonas mucosa]